MSPCFTCCPATVLPSTCPETTKPLSHSTPAAVGRSRTAQTNTGKSQRVGKSESEARGRQGAAVGARVDTERKRMSRACGGRGSSRCRPSSQGMAHGMNSDMKIGGRRTAELPTRSSPSQQPNLTADPSSSCILALLVGPAGPIHSKGADAIIPRLQLAARLGS
jgi:hypothetical protein